MIRADLGNDAVILNSKVVQTGGFLGFFRKKSIEVIAAVDPVPKPEPRVKEKPKRMPSVSQAPNVNIGKESSVQNGMNEKKIERSSEDILSELTELKQMLRNIPVSESGGVSYPEPIQKVNQLLVRQEIDQNIRSGLMAALLEKWFKEGSNATYQDVLLWCNELMLQRISNYSFGEISFTKKFINVVGPTGVGKTTTLAKIAADCILKFNKKTALITTDTYRIAAIEQLKTYAKILSIPVEICYNLEDFSKACATFKDYDVVLIDTAGRNFRNQQYVEELKKVIDYNKEMETYLVLSLTAKQRDMEEIYQQFSTIFINQFIFTKIDETSYYGAMYNMIDKFKKGAAYITNGQNVPDDRISATPGVVTNLILGVDKV